jgi:hypothetical protein
LGVRTAFWAAPGPAGLRVTASRPSISA